MKREVTPGVFIGVIALVVAIVAGFAWRVWLAPSATALPGSSARAAKRPTSHGPTADQTKALLEWEKKQHIGAYANQ